MPGRTPGARLVTATGEKAQETHVSSELPDFFFHTGGGRAGPHAGLAPRRGVRRAQPRAGCAGQRLPGVQESSGQVQAGKSFPSWSQQSSYASRSPGTWSMGHTPVQGPRLAVTPNPGVPQPASPKALSSPTYSDVCRKPLQQGGCMFFLVWSSLSPGPCGCRQMLSPELSAQVGLWLCWKQRLLYRWDAMAAARATRGSGGIS